MVWTLSYCLNFLVRFFPAATTWWGETFYALCLVCLLALVGTLSFAINVVGEREAYTRPWLSILINVGCAATQLAAGLYVSRRRGARSPRGTVRRQPMSPRSPTAAVRLPEGVEVESI